MKPILLPYPISANRYWRHFKGMTIRSPEAMKFIKDVRLIAFEAKAKKLEGPVELNIIFHPRLTRRGASSLIRQDLSNTIKVTEDALQGVAYVNEERAPFSRTVFVDF